MKEIKSKINIDNFTGEVREVLKPIIEQVNNDTLPYNKDNSTESFYGHTARLLVTTAIGHASEGEESQMRALRRVVERHLKSHGQGILDFMPDEMKKALELEE